MAYFFHHRLPIPRIQGAATQTPAVQTPQANALPQAIIAMLANHSNTAGDHQALGSESEATATADVSEAAELKFGTKPTPHKADK